MLTTVWEDYGMPEKQNESKFMAMLERRGIVRKTGSEGSSPEKGPDSASARPEADLRSMFGPPAGESVNVTPAARQPVPGMLNPVIPVEQPEQPEQAEQPKRVQPQPAAAGPEPGQPWPLTGFQPAPPSPVVHSEPEQLQPAESAEAGMPKPVARVGFEQHRRTDVQKPAPFFSGADYKDDVPDKPYVAAPEIPYPLEYRSQPGAQQAQGALATPVVQPVPTEPERPPEPLPIEHYTERYLDIDELYEVLTIKSKRTDTVYLIEEYMKTLPESLPESSRRDIVSKIVAASGFDFDLLIGDGVLRVKMLKDYAEKFARNTDEYVTARNADLDELEQQIMRIRRLIENRRELHKKQFFAIEAEAQRLKEILTFISG